MASFHVDARISVKMEYDLAVQLGELILASNPEDQKLRALGYKLVNLDDSDSDSPIEPGRSAYAENMIRSTGQIISDAQTGYKPPIRIRPKFVPKSL